MDNIYLSSQANFTIHVFTNQSKFVDENGSVYVSNFFVNYGIDRIRMNSVQRERVFNTTDRCLGLFVDSNQSIYCSLHNRHIVAKFSLRNFSMKPVIVAGTDLCADSLSNFLTFPYGIFVHINHSLYVADSGNNRIQHFLPMNRSAITVAGYGAPNTIILNEPRAVIVDQDGYLFISDSFNNRIIGSGPNGFRCVVSCVDQTGPLTERVYVPNTIGFNSRGDLIVADQGHDRVQMFQLKSNYCSKLFFLSIYYKRKLI